MSIAVLVQANTELRRLAIAGSKLAKDDFRLKRLIEPLEQVGKKAPVFAKVAQELNGLLEAKPKESAERLLKASTLVSAVLYTQGQAQVPGEVEVLPSADFQDKIATNTSSRRLRPILDAMRTTGSGRYEILEEAFNEGLFKDLRLMRPALDHLEDPYGPVADLFAEKIIPSFGPKVVPYLKEGLDIKGGRRDARALAVIHAIAGTDVRELVLEAMDDGNATLKIAAIQCLADDPTAVSFIKEHVKAKNKEVRAAALEALGDQQSADVVELLMAALKGKDTSSAVLPIVRNQSSELVEKLLQLASEQFAGMKKSAPPKSLISKFRCTIQCLQGRTDEGTRTLVRELLAEHKTISKWKAVNYVSGQDILESISELARDQKDTETNKFLMENVLKLSGMSREHAFQVLLEEKTREEVYNWAMEGLEKKGSMKAVKTLIDNHLGIYRHRYYYYVDDVRVEKWDPRWLDWAIKKKDEGIVMALARGDHKKSVDFVKAKLKTAKADRADDYLEVLIRCEGDRAYPLFEETVKRLSKAKRYYLWGIFRLAEKFGERRLSDMEKLAAELPDEATMQLLDVLEPMIFNAQAKQAQEKKN